MRQSIGNTWIFSLVITFTLIFAGFLVLTLSYSKIYKMKNEITTIIEKYEGLTSESSDIINDYLKNTNYRTTGKCPIGSYASDNLISINVVSDSSKQYYYCIEHRMNNMDKIVFKVTLFYDFNLPVFGKLVKYSVVGDTYGIKNARIFN